MRGTANRQETMLTLMTPGKRVPEDHPIRRIKAIADAELERLSPVFDRMYSERGRYSIPPERLLKSCLLIALYSVRSERQLCEQLDYNLLFRFFLDMGNDEDAFDASSFAKNRDRLIEHEVARLFFEGVIRQAKEAHLISTEHFTVDGTLIDAWASFKSFRPKNEKGRRDDDDPSNPTVNFRGEQRSNETHQSTTDPAARLATKKGMGKAARLSYSGHVMMENRNGLCVDVSIAPAAGGAEREQALYMLGRLQDRGFRPRTLGADKGYDTTSFVGIVRTAGVTPHVAQHTTKRRSRIDGRTTRHSGYALSQRARKRVEEIFGWMKTIGGLRKTRYRGVERNGLWAYFVASAYNLLRMSKLIRTDAAG
ncbi:MAG TPA: IS5 family transposase [Vicinamibacterales bacterium]|nr:IS5 family transposase [Vicinamibacterales bacterium]